MNFVPVIQFVPPKTPRTFAAYHAKIAVGQKSQLQPSSHISIKYRVTVQGQFSLEWRINRVSRTTSPNIATAQWVGSYVIFKVGRIGKETAESKLSQEQSFISTCIWSDTGNYRYVVPSLSSRLHTCVPQYVPFSLYILTQRLVETRFSNLEVLNVFSNLMSFKYGNS
jgi:hypothetical protein